ncbi:hypothetical protein TrVE_jg13374 [Triparma verrucosa]|uniref:phosphoribosylaminoimidazole carboxylase n=1 Tax=Triparma verrucosa TaxID=1606542 RepID=A0A9W7CE07_9STRA|nr:hypothetical protein TrVE_jg13374 [Triparma verrucosa]
MRSLVLRGARAGLNYAIGGANFGRIAMKMRGSRPLRAMFSGNAGGGGGEVGGREGKFSGIRLNEAALADLVGVVCEDTGVENPLEGVAELDHKRRERTHFPEVVFGETKTPSQISSILSSLSSTSSLPVLATRVSPEIFAEVQRIYQGPGSLEYNETAKMIILRTSDPPQIPPNRKTVIVCTAGTTDIPIAEEVSQTLLSSQIPPLRIYDCGVAGLHRILKKIPIITSPDVACIIVCAGMDGALPSVISGLVKVPVIAVPTSVGYGYGSGGNAALGTMLNSCSPGVCVVNIDNGFGAASVAYKIVKGGEK